MRISVFGMGYVGCVSMGCLVRMGHSVVGVDINDDKVRLVREGMATIVEKGIDDLIAAGRSSGRLDVTGDCSEAVLASEMSLLCVPTPPGRGGHLDTGYVERVSVEIGTAMRGKEEHHTVVIRSTIPPGTTRKVIGIIGSASGREHGSGFSVVHNPEFLREGSSIEDFFNPPMIVLGTDSAEGAEAVEEMYRDIPAEVVRVPLEVAEMIKYASNSFHAMKVSFANEIGRVCGAMGIDGAEVMRVFRLDRILNVSSAYLRPGFAFGGSCLPKDLGALCAMAEAAGTDTPLLHSVERSNSAQIASVFQRVVDAGSRTVALVGLSFKEGTDDLRNSPAVALAEMLHGKGYEVRIYDDNVIYSNLTGRNRAFIDEHLPHIGRMLHGSVEDALSSAGTVVVLQKCALPEELTRGRTMVEVMS